MPPVSALIRFVAIIAVTLAVSFSTALAQKRVALVIGNSSYTHVPALPNPTNDSAKVALKLKSIGFEVLQADNLDFDGFRKTLRDFSKKATGADMAVVFYAGHGMEVNKSNYLIPVDAKLETDREISYEAVPLELVTEAVNGAKGLRLVMLDACRNNPFASKIKMTSPTRSIGRGLSFIEPSAGTLVSYAAREGTTAEDGQGEHSPYTAALLENLGQPGLEVNFLFRKVRDQVLENTGGKQEPFTYGSLPGRQIFLVPGAQQPTTSPDTSKPTTAHNTDALFWAAIQDSDNPALFEEYLKRFPQGIFSSIAQIRLDNLKKGGQGGGQPASAGKEEGEEQVAAVDTDQQQQTEAARPPEKLTRSVSAFGIGRWPEGITLGAGGLWVAESGRRTIARLDPDSGKLLNRVKVGRLPVGMITGPDGTVYSLVHTDRMLWAQYKSGKGKRVLKLEGYPDRMVRHGDDIWILTWPEGSSGSIQFVRFNMRSGKTKSFRTLRKDQDYAGNNREFTVADTGKYEAPLIWTVFGNGLVLALSGADMSRFAYGGVKNTFASSVEVTEKYVIVTGRDETTKKGVILVLDSTTAKLIKRHDVPEMVYKTTKASGFILAMSGPALYVISATNGNIVREIALDGPWGSIRGMYADDNRLYATRYANDTDGQVLILEDWKP